MSQEDARAFMEKMKNDARFREKILAEEDGEKCLQLINQEGQAVNGHDLINQEDVQGSALHLPVKGVRLIELLK